MLELAGKYGEYRGIPINEIPISKGNTGHVEVKEGNFGMPSLDKKPLPFIINKGMIRGDGGAVSMGTKTLLVI